VKPKRPITLFAAAALAGLALASCPPAWSGEREWRALFKQGDNYYRVGDYASSEAIARKLVAEAVVSFGANSPHTAQSLNALADALQAQGKNRQAEPLLRRALAIRERVLGPEHPDTALCLNQLGALLRLRDKTAEAVAVDRRALAIREKIRGPEHFETAVSLNNLAVALHDEGNDAEAEALLRRALTIFERVPDATHQIAANTRRNLDAVVAARTTKAVAPASQAREVARAARAKEAWLNAKWARKQREQQALGFTTGTIDEFLDEHKNLPVVARTARSLLFASPKRGDTFYSLFQARSTEGTSLLLGPVRMPRMDIGRERYARYWRLQEPAIELSEKDNYSALYVDHLNFAVMFVIFERRPGGDVPVQALFYPARVRQPSLATRGANDALIVRLRGWVNVALPMLAKAVLGLDAP
jgi:tetratricopeptide (TPR) repeat protein